MSQSETVTIRLPAEVKGKLEALAVSTNRSKSWLAAQAIAAYVEEQSWQIQQIEEAVALAKSEQAVALKLLRDKQSCNKTNNF